MASNKDTLSEYERKQLMRSTKPLRPWQAFILAVWSLVGGLVFYACLGIIAGLICGVMWDVFSIIGEMK